MNNFSKSLRLTVILIVFFGVCYPVFIWTIGRLMPNQSEGLPIEKNGKLLGYENIGQNFTADKYFWGRPSAVNYNAASTGGSNQGPTNPGHLDLVKARIDSFIVHNPGVKTSDIPSEMVTASGGGLDPHITPQGAIIQIARVAKARGLSEDKIKALVESHIEKPYLGFFGPERVNVLKLNLAIDELK
ncbi:MAG TPA: K(+)-transporting ATPase subunit C [Candidatus Kapabacteria bacterium]|nr:K(+)-transporting ATPase subunit C [Candidatus Kapabacteria bacterium]